MLFPQVFGWVPVQSMAILYWPVLFVPEIFWGQYWHFRFLQLTLVYCYKKQHIYDNVSFFTQPKKGHIRNPNSFTVPNSHIKITKSSKKTMNKGWTQKTSDSNSPLLFANCHRSIDLTPNQQNNSALNSLSVHFQPNQHVLSTKFTLCLQKNKEE